MPRRIETLSLIILASLGLAACDAIPINLPSNPDGGLIATDFGPGTGNQDAGSADCPDCWGSDASSPPPVPDASSDGGPSPMQDASSDALGDALTDGSGDATLSDAGDASLGDGAADASLGDGATDALFEAGSPEAGAQDASAEGPSPQDSSLAE